MKKLFPILLFFLMIAPVQAGSGTASITNSGRILSSSPGTSFTEWQAYRIGNTSKFVFTVDFGSVPSGESLTSVILKVRAYSNGDGNTTTTLHRLTYDNYDYTSGGGYPTWNNKAFGANWQGSSGAETAGVDYESAGCDILVTHSGDEVGDYEDWDITACVLPDVGSDPVQKFIVQHESLGSTWQYFFPPGGTSAPYIEWVSAADATPTPTETPTPTPTGGGGGGSPSPCLIDFDCITGWFEDLLVPDPEAVIVAYDSAYETASGKFPYAYSFALNDLFDLTYDSDIPPAASMTIKAVTCQGAGCATKTTVFNQSVLFSSGTNPYLMYETFISGTVRGMFTASLWVGFVVYLFGLTQRIHT